MKNDEIIITEEKNEKRPKKLLIIICSIVTVLLVGIILFFTLVCFHDWQEATCTAPITCSKCGATEGAPLNEEDFLKALAKGLEDRWVLTDANEEKETLTKDDWESYFNAEYNAIIKFENANFSDKTMSKLAKKYVECIVQSKECLAYYGTNQWTNKYANGIYNTRVETLYKINSIKPIPVSDSNKQQLQGMISEGEVINMVNDLFSTVKFKQSEDDYGWKTYQAVVTNSTTVNFSYFSFEIDLIDKDGVTLTTAYAAVDNWESGEKSRFTFNTNEEFATMEVERASWDY